jgi:hypothetical protein
MNRVVAQAFAHDVVTQEEKMNHRGTETQRLHRGEPAARRGVQPLHFPLWLSLCLRVSVVRLQCPDPLRERPQ